MVPSLAQSVIPEVHILDAAKPDHVSHLSYRTDHKGKERVSFSEDDSRLEWRISKSHSDNLSVSSSISPWITNEGLNSTIYVTVPESAGSLFSKDQIEFLESMCLSFITAKQSKDLCASGWEVCADHIDDLLSSTPNLIPAADQNEEDIVPETNSVRINSVLDFEKFIRRLEQGTEPNATALFIRLVLFQESKIIHFMFSRMSIAVHSLSAIPAARIARKSGTYVSSGRLSVVQRCLLPLLAGNSKPFLVIDVTGVGEADTVQCQSLLDLGEKLCLCALPCFPEGGGSQLRMADFEIVHSIDALPPRTKQAGRKIKSVPSVDVSVASEAVPPVDHSIEQELRQDISLLDAELDGGRKRQEPSPSTIDTYEGEITELKAKNLILRSEIDRLKLGGGGTTGVGANAYTAHLVTEVKQLRQELLSVEVERRKYSTSKRLVESLIEKSNKGKAEVAAKAAKMDELKRSEEAMRTELKEMKKNCDFLLESNRKLQSEMEEMKRAELEAESRAPTIDSFYHQFLFPFNGKRDMEKSMVHLFELLAKIERNCAINCPSALLDVRKSIASLDKIKDCANQLIAASEKLEVSAVTVLKGLAGNEVSSRRGVRRGS